MSVVKQKLKPNLPDIERADELIMADIDGNVRESYGRIGDNQWLYLYWDYPEDSEKYARALIGDYDDSEVYTDREVQERLYKEMKYAMDEYSKGYEHYYYLIFDQNGNELAFFY